MTIQLKVNCGPGGVSLTVSKTNEQDDPGKVVEQGEVGGAAESKEPKAGGDQDDPGPGGGPGSGSVVVVGPIVLGCCDTKKISSAANAAKSKADHQGDPKAGGDQDDPGPGG